jgi:predicted N-acetyltransferase YhbS
MYDIQNEQPGNSAAIDELLTRAFNGALRDKPANRLRRHQQPLVKLCFAVHHRQRLIASVRIWPLAVAQRWPALLLGPFAVDPDLQGRGLGCRLMWHTLAAAERDGHELTFLIGDHGYYRRFGFEPAGAKNFDVDLPPRDSARLLCAELRPAAARGKSGLVAPWRCHRQALTDGQNPASMASAA